MFNENSHMKTIDRCQLIHACSKWWCLPVHPQLIPSHYRSKIKGAKEKCVALGESYCRTSNHGSSL